MHSGEVQLKPIGCYRHLRPLLWNGSTLYASKGYQVVQAEAGTGAALAWSETARFDPEWWRRITGSQTLTSRLFRDGFHCLIALRSGHLIGAVPGAIVRCCPGSSEFQTVYAVQRGTRPLNIAADPDDRLYWGEYFNNPERDAVHVYGSADRGVTWEIAYTFAAGLVRHIHNIIYDRWDDCFWVLTGDYASECRILRASRDWRSVDVVVSGNQQYRAVSFIPTEEALYFATDTPLDRNYVYRLDRSGDIARLESISSSSLYGCQVGNALFFSTMIEPSEVNPSQDAALFGSAEGNTWSRLLGWRKDPWPSRYFQYGNVILPAGENTTHVLAATPVALRGADLTLHAWEVSGAT